MPPITDAMRTPRMWRTKSIASLATCWASSRVGHSTSAPGVAARKLRILVGSLRLDFFGNSWPAALAASTCSVHAKASRRSCSRMSASKALSTGSKYAAVLPLPVWLDTIKSTNFLLPSGDFMASGMALSCTGVGLVKPSSATACTSDGERPKASKAFGSAGTLLTSSSASIATVSVATDDVSSLTLAIFSSICASVAMSAASTALTASWLSASFTAASVIGEKSSFIRIHACAARQCGAQTFLF